jgi:predicted tellurium resistance membrane protein TerC
MDFAPLFNPENLPSLLTLTLLEIVLGIDNVIFITILAGKLPAERQAWARRLGLMVALVSRILLLFSISWVMRLKNDLFEFLDQGISAKDLILIGGGLFLLGKAVHEIYENVERPADHQPQELDKSGALENSVGNFMTSFIIQVVILDVVFSLDSVITAVGLVNDPSKLVIMVTAVILAVIVMIAFAKPVGDFVQKHASVRVLALAFLVMIGCLLVAEGFDQHIEKGYIYFSMAFALGMEFLNMRMRSRRDRLAARERKEP